MYMTESKQQLVPVFFAYMHETSKPEYANNQDVQETRALILEMEKAGLFAARTESHQAFVQVSKSHKLVFHLLTSKELGYKDVHMEVPIIKGVTYADIFLREVNLALMIDGPTHYFLDEPTIRIPDLLDNVLDSFVDVVRLGFQDFNDILQFGPLVT
jgi:hypothetical protein